MESNNNSQQECKEVLSAEEMLEKHRVFHIVNNPETLRRIKSAMEEYASWFTQSGREGLGSGLNQDGAASVSTIRSSSASQIEQLTNQIILTTSRMVKDMSHSEERGMMEVPARWIKELDSLLFQLDKA